MLSDTTNSNALIQRLIPPLSCSSITAQSQPSRPNSPVSDALPTLHIQSLGTGGNHSVGNDYAARHEEESDESPSTSSLPYSQDSFLNDIDTEGAGDGSQPSLPSIIPPLTPDISDTSTIDSQSSQSSSSPSSSQQPIPPTSTPDTNDNDTDSLQLLRRQTANVKIREDPSHAPPTRTSYSASYADDDDETRALMERFRQMRELQEKPVVVRPPTPQSDPEVELTQPEPHPFLFPWEEAAAVLEKDAVSCTHSRQYSSASQDWRMGNDVSHDALDTRDARRCRALTFLERLLIDFFAQLHGSVRQLKPGRDSPPGDLRRSPESHESQGSQAEVGPASFGIRLAIVNRKTGKDQESLFPYDLRPAKTAAVLAHMARVYFTASVLYEAILTDGIVTKRDIYYRNVSLFGRQRSVDKIVDDLVCTAGLKRQDFHVCATSRGLIMSNTLRIYLVNGEEFVLSSTNCTLIPPQERIDSIEASNGLEWVLLVEKDAVMQALCGARLLDDPRLGPGAVITGKGYPDLSTLQLVRSLADQFPSARIYALVDADPHGIDILSVYTFGSRANAYSEDYIGLPLGDRLEWIGIKATEWSSLGHLDDLLPLGVRDLQLALTMCTCRLELPAEWRRELARMVHLHRKAETQILCGADPHDDGLERALLGTQTQVEESVGGKNRLVEYIVERVRGR